MAEKSHDRADDETSMPNVEVLHIGVSHLQTDGSHGPVSATWSIMIWMIEGSTTTSVNGTIFSLGQGQALLIRQGDIVTQRWGPEKNIHLGYVQFIPDRPIAEDRPQYFPLTSEDGASHVLTDLIRLEASRPPGWWNAVTPGFRFVLAMLVSGFERFGDGTETVYQAPVANSLRHVANVWAENSAHLAIPLPHLARAAGVTPAHLCRLYAQQFGMSPIAALRLIRLKRAATLLSLSNLTVAQVAHEVGFRNEFHFSRAFKDITDLSPSAYRADGTRSFPLPPEIRRMQRYLTGS